MRIALIAALLFSTPALAQTEKERKALMAMTPEGVQRLVTSHDDALELVATFTTEPVFKQKRGLLGIVWSDAYIRAFVDKKSGSTTYQLFQFVRYQGEWRYFQSVNYSVGGEGLSSTDLRVLSRDVESCTRLTGCTFRETVAFEIPQELIDKIVAAGRERGPLVWAYKLKSQRGEDWSDGIMAAEITGIVNAVAEYKRSRGLP